MIPVKISQLGDVYEVLIYHQQSDNWVSAIFNGANLFDLQTAESFAEKLTEIHDLRAKFQ